MAIQIRASDIANGQARRTKLGMGAIWSTELYDVYLIGEVRVEIGGLAIFLWWP